MWIAGLKIYNEKVDIICKWQSMNGAITKAPLGEKSTGPNPTDRSKSGTKRILLVEDQGIPLGIKKRTEEGCQNMEQEDG